MTDQVVWEGAEELRGQVVPIDEVKPFDGNPRRGAVEDLMASLQRWGQVRPVLVKTDGTIVAGHHVTEAARRLGWTHVAVVTHHFANDEEAKAYLIADNALQEKGTILHEQQMALLGDVEDLSGTGLTEDDLADAGAVIRRTTEWVPYYELKAHPSNYREHPQEQIEHLTRSLEENGFYRNIVAAKDGTILAGHGLWVAARRKGIRKLPVTRLDCGPDDPVAVRILAGDNELGRLADQDDRALSEMLRELQEGDASQLVGTGYDAMMLANLVLVSRSDSEIENYDAAAEWVGMPEFEAAEDRISLVLHFDSEEERKQLIDQLGVNIVKGNVHSLSAWWPPREREDLASLRFEDSA